jgi:hypothetical protein
MPTCLKPVALGWPNTGAQAGLGWRTQDKAYGPRPLFLLFVSRHLRGRVIIMVYTQVLSSMLLGYAVIQCTKCSIVSSERNARLVQCSGHY